VDYFVSIGTKIGLIERRKNIEDYFNYDSSL
jgi:hypothetical protein